MNRTQIHIPAVDLGTAGHLPYAVQTAEPTRTRAEQPATDGAREHTEPENTVPNRDTFIAALPGAVDEAMQKAIPHLYTPELATQIAKNMATELSNPQPTEPSHYPWCEPGACTSHRYEDGEVTTEHLGAKLVMPVPDGLDCYNNELLYAQLGYDENFVQSVPTASINSGGNGTLLDDDSLDKVIGDLTQFTDGLRAMRQQMTNAAGTNAEEPVTAAQRGQDWMNKWGCTPWCVAAHDQTGGLECHASAPNETQLRAADLDCTGYSENGRTLPWLSAQVIVCNEKPQAYGRETRVWMSYGVHVAEISPAQAREALDQMRAFTAQLAAVVDMADRVAADDFPGDPEVARLDKEATDRRIKAVGARA